MQNGSDKSTPRPKAEPRSDEKLLLVGIECECLEGPTWGMGRQVRKLLEGLTKRDDLRGRFRFVLYSNNTLPDEALFDDPLFVRRPCGLKALLGSWAPSSFSIHYYVLLPLRLWWDSFRESVCAMYYPNYMLPIIHPPHVRSLVMLTDDIFREAYNPALPFRYRIAYRIFATFWAKHRASKLMAISHSSSKTLERKGVNPNRIVVNALGVLEPVQSAIPAPSSDFLFVGQAFERRMLRESLTAFENIARERPALTFRFIGQDKYPVPTIAKLIEDVNIRLGRTAITDEAYVTDDALAGAYRASGALVYVSEVEGFGMPPIEALSYGTPAIIADTALNREIYGTNAFLVPTPVSVEGIESSMRRSLDDDRARTSIMNAGPEIIARYRWQSHADRFVDIISSMIS